MKQANKDLLELVIKPVLAILAQADPRMEGRWPENLILGTALAESPNRLIRQTGGGPALGWWQMEPVTHDDVYNHYLRYPNQTGIYECLKEASQYAGPFPAPASLLAWNTRYACAMARIHYWRVPDPLPKTIAGMAEYWKKHYNTSKGKGTVKKYCEAWRKR